MYGKILQQAMQGARNLGQAGKNYGQIAIDMGRDKGIRALDKGTASLKRKLNQYRGRGVSDLAEDYPKTAIGLGAAGLLGGATMVGRALEPAEKRENPLEYKKKQIESTYNYEFTERNNENKFTYMPEMKIENDRLVVKLDDDAVRHAGYIDGYATQDYYGWGTDNRDIIYEVDGIKHAYDFSLFGGAKLIPLEDLENNPFTKDLPSGNQMMPEDFR